MLLVDQVLLSTGHVVGGSSAFVEWFADGGGSIAFVKVVWGFKCFCQIDLVVVDDQMPLSTGHVDGNSSAIVKLVC